MWFTDVHPLCLMHGAATTSFPTGKRVGEDECRALRVKTNVGLIGGGRCVPGGWAVGLERQLDRCDGRHWCWPMLHRCPFRHTALLSRHVTSHEVRQSSRWSSWMTVAFPTALMNDASKGFDSTFSSKSEPAVTLLIYPNIIEVTALQEVSCTPCLLIARTSQRAMLQSFSPEALKYVPSAVVALITPYPFGQATRSVRPNGLEEEFRKKARGRFCPCGLRCAFPCTTCIA